MSENVTPVQRSDVEATLYHLTKHTWEVSDADLEAVVAGTPLNAGSSNEVRIEIAFPDPQALKDFI
ncbi:hypothetical protein MPY17_40190 (plasmid) [Rhodococcus opacus]|uniref:hypothetical protein n=1 Tax=Rhodococcus opacus TaxID=37919 RepID=UPI001FF57AFA|nr:hypothetical protein [Rhodococcus opacus]UOT08481.1 hypothetical protein MPY17_40190 [Rhodococcus opacus]